jgi:hypothetical protein
MNKEDSNNCGNALPEDRKRDSVSPEIIHRSSGRLNDAFRVLPFQALLFLENGRTVKEDGPAMGGST